MAVLCSLLIVTTPSAAQSAPAATTRVMPTAPVVGFNAGNIISDAVFFDSTTLTAREIDTFLRGKVATCRSGYTCLKDFKQSTPNKAADTYCNGYAGATNESAADIIYKAARSCGINPQVLIVMLEKEQSLVTHTWPSSWRFDMALGQGCPDTAACDPAFAGFFYQIYGAARQMKIYAEGKYFTWYAPGKTWNILYNPNHSCGSAPVYVENTATAALYYYTPYQPNAAALAAGSGTGDSCSAYGNRNFYNFFTAWFGSTQTKAPSKDAAIVQATGDSKVYLVDDGNRFHIQTVEDLNAYSSKLGAVKQVTASERDSYVDGGQIGRYVHDPRSGTLYLLESDGTKHRFPSAALVASYGYAFDDYQNLSATLIDKFAVGSEVSSVFRIGSNGEIYKLDGATKRYIPNLVALDAAYEGTNRYIASMSVVGATKLSVGAPYLAAGSYVQVRDTPAVYLTTSGRSIIHIPSFAIAQEFGAGDATSLITIEASQLSSFTVAPTTLTPVVSCGQKTYVATQGSLQEISGSSASMFTPTALSDAECAGFKKKSGSIATPLFFQATSGEVYWATGGSFQYIANPSEISRLSGGGAVRVIKLSPSTIRTYGVLPASLNVGQAVQFAGDGRVFRWDGKQLRYVSSFNTLLALYGGVPPITPLPAGTIGAYSIGANH